MKKLLNHPFLKTHGNQLWKFIICGGTGFVLDMGSLNAMVEYGNVNAHIAGILSSFVGATFVFFVNKFFTFKNREKAGSQVMKFVLVYGVSIVGNAAIYNLLLWIGLPYLWSKVVAIGIGAVWNYALSHGFIFKKNEQVDVVVA